MTTMKKLLLALSLLLIFLVGCGDNDEVNNPPQNDTGTDQDVTEDNNNGNQDDTEGQNLANNADEPPADTSVDSNHPYPFIQFDLDVDMEDDLDIIEVEYEQEPN